MLVTVSNSRCPTVWADMVSVCHTSSEDRRTHGPGYEKASVVLSYNMSITREGFDLVGLIRRMYIRRIITKMHNTLRLHAK